MGSRSWIGKYSTLTSEAAGAPWPIITSSRSHKLDGVRITQNSEGAIYALIGATNPFDPFDEEIWIEKVSPDGEVDTTFGSGGIAVYDAGEYDHSSGIALDSSENIHVVGFQYLRDAGGPFFWLGEFDPSGLLAGPPLTEIGATGSSIAIDGAGNMFIVGSTYLLGHSEILVTKHDAHGVMIWRDIVHIPEVFVWDFGIGIALGSDGSIYVTATPNEGPGFIRKYTPDGFSDDGPPDFAGP